LPAFVQACAAATFGAENLALYCAAPTGREQRALGDETVSKPTGHLEAV